MNSGRHVIIVGEMGVGKTTTGKLLAERLNRPFLDSDVWIEQRTGRDGSAIAVEEGIDRLHEIELEVCLDMCEQPEAAVIAPAASVVDVPRGRAVLEDNLTVWLVADREVTEARLGAGTHRRSYDTGERDRLWESRRPRLERLARVVVDTSEHTPGEVVEVILAGLGELPLQK